MSIEKIAKMYHGCEDIKVTPSMAFHSHSSKSTITFLMCLLLFKPQHAMFLMVLLGFQQYTIRNTIFGVWHFLGVVSPLRLIYMLMRMYKGNDFIFQTFMKVL